MTDVKAIDAEAARRLLTALRDMRWNWSSAELADVANRLGWTNFEVLEGKAAFADGPWQLGGEEVAVDLKDDNVTRVMLTVTERRGKKTEESLAFMANTWRDLVTTATNVLGEPTLRTGQQNPDVQWRGPNATIGVQNVRVAVVVNWATNEFQDQWNHLRAAE